MGLLGRLRGEDWHPVALDARVLDGEHLFLAVSFSGLREADRLPEAGAVVLRTPTGEVDLALEPGRAASGLPLGTAVVRLADHLVDDDADSAAEVECELLVRHGRRLVPLEAQLPDHRGPGLPAPRTPDGRARWEVLGDDEEPRLRVRRRPAPTQVEVVALRGRDEETEVVLPDGPADEVEVRRHDTVLATLPLRRDGARRVLPLAGLSFTLTGTGSLYVGGAALARAHHHLTRPHFATALPPLLVSGQPGLELRWSPSGQLVLHRDDSAAGADR